MRNLGLLSVPVGAAAALAILLSCVPAQANDADITGAGSTFVYPVMSKWSAAYYAKGLGKVQYHPIGSGAALPQVRSGGIDFGASDAPAPSEVIARDGLYQFPLVIGGLVPIVNIAGLKPGELKLTGSVLAAIYLGKVKTWNDPAIAALNPAIDLPAAAISVTHRIDSSGSSFNWANYLSKASEEWRTKVGWATTLSWPVGMGGKGNDGLAALVARTPNSIGYVEYTYAMQKKLSYALVMNKAGKFVVPSAASFRAAAANADWAGARDFSLILTDAPGDDAYPIAATVFVVAQKDPRTPAHQAPMLAFFRWIFQEGPGIAGDLNYVPLPPPLISRIEEHWRAQLP